jgi:hypothetical protein
VVGRTGSTVLDTSVNLAETSDTDGLAKVGVAGDGGSTDVEPVHALGRKLLVVTGLDGVNPTLTMSVLSVTACGWYLFGRTGNGKLSLTLQEGSVGLDELLGINVANRDSGHFVGSLGFS